MQRVEYSKQSLKALRKMDKPTASTIIEKINLLNSNPTALVNNIKRLQGSTLSRLRVGDWRIVYSNNGIILMIEKIVARGNVY